MVNMLITYQLNDGEVIEINHPEEFEFRDLDGNSLGNAEVIKRHNNDLILAEAAFVISAEHEKIIIPSDAAFMESKAGAKQPFDFNGLVKVCGFSSVKYKFDKQGDESSAWVVAYPLY
ncbi:hypothetical protein [Colwellia sp. TT2012]|uniref:hypothetical protein n=1 Tax=Colwellia sp. TT2012 TaxID=1720342 RepID=UPI00070910A9|nr:hypothetical protein [Colwellia sp. TT2012]